MTKRAELPRRTNSYIISGNCPSIKDAIRAENRRIENRILEKYLSKCMVRLFGEPNPYKRNEGWPFIWH